MAATTRAVSNRLARGLASVGALDVVGVGANGLTLGGVAIPSASELNRLAGLASDVYPLVAKEISFVETTGAGVYTGSVVLPAATHLVDILVVPIALWTATTSATLKVGDVADDDGYFTGVNLKATDLLLGEDLSFAHPQDKAGVYLLSEQRIRYSSTARTIAGVVTTVGAAGNAGRTRMVVIYANMTPVVATKV